MTKATFRVEFKCQDLPHRPGFWMRSTTCETLDEARRVEEGIKRNLERKTRIIKTTEEIV